MLNGESTNGAGATDAPFLFVGAHLAIDFANTVAVERGADVVDGLHDFCDLLAWLEAAGIVPSDVAAKMLARNAGTRQAAAAHTDALAFRAVLRRMLERIQGALKVDDATMAEINARLSQCGCRRRLERRGDAFTIAIGYRFEQPADLLMPLANAAADLLRHLDLALIKRCKREDCTCYFYDTSKNHTRTWCSMERCGNRVKAATYYRRSKALAS